MTSAKFHTKVIEEKLNFLRFVDNELGYDLKHYVCVACDMLIHKIQEDFRKVELTSEHDNMVFHLRHILKDCKKYLTILYKLGSLLYTPKYNNLPLLLLSMLAEVFHIFTSLVNMFDGIEKDIWFVYQLGARKSGQRSYTNFIESNTDIRKSKKLSSRKFIPSSTLNIPEMSAFQPSFPYLEHFRNNIFSMFKKEIEEPLEDIIKRYVQKPPVSHAALTVSHSSNQRKGELTQAEELKKQICEDILTGTLISQVESSEALEDRFLEDLTISIHLSERHQINFFAVEQAFKYFQSIQD